MGLTHDEWQIVSDGLICFKEFVDIDDNLVAIELRDIEDTSDEMAHGDDDNEEWETKVL